MNNIYVYDWSSITENNITAIRAFGIDEHGKNTCVKVEDFLPYFYIGLPTQSELDYYDSDGKHIKMTSIINWDNDNLCRVYDTLCARFFRNHRPVRYEYVSRRKMYYTHKTSDMKDIYYPYMKVYFKTNNYFKTFGYKLNTSIHMNGFGTLNLHAYETNVSSVLQFCCSLNLPMSGWIQFTGKQIESSVQEYEVSMDNIHAVNDPDKLTPNPTVLSFDIEVYSANTNKFPNAANYSDCIFQISCVFWKLNSDESTDVLLTIGYPNIDSENIITYCYDDEHQLLQGFVNLMHQYKPHIITGWNILGFDLPYMADRCSLLCVDGLKNIGMLNNMTNDNMVFRSFGKTTVLPNWNGMIILDLLTFARREIKAENYKLETIASQFVQSHKDPLTHKDIFRSYKHGVLEVDRYGEEGLALLAEVGRYCVQDSVLVKKLFIIFDIWIGMTEMAQVCNVPCSYLYTQGQQIRVFSQVYKYCYNNNFVVERIVGDCNKYEGAFVREPTPGLYNYVVPFDFTSLYPSIIIAYNIDYSTYVIDDSIPDDLCNIIEWFDDEAKIEYRYRFLKEPLGILPVICQRLWVARSNTKKLMKEIKHSDKVMANILDKRQLAYKISLNSIYGVMGAPEGMIPLMMGAASVTAMGRFNIIKAQNYLESHYNAVTIYGDTDSTHVQFPHIKPEKLWNHSIEIAKELKRDGVFPKPMGLEFEEAIYEPFFILSKKRYMWRYYNSDSKDIGSKGVLLVRRDNSKYTQCVYRETVNNIFEQKSKEYISQYICDMINKCCSSGLPISYFILTKEVGDVEKYKIRDIPADEKKRALRFKNLKCTEETYKLKSLPAHVQLAIRLQDRGIQVATGERIEYIITDRGGLKAKLFDKIEEPTYQQMYSNIIHIDYIHYIHSLINPIDELLNILFDTPNFVKNQYTLRVTKYKLLEELKSWFNAIVTIDE